ncbi:MAG: hypothetical protein J7K95_04240 [Thermoplasmata archaeon]|nr:hypothetical protein [Thermoplasmata archaeon]
MSGKCEDGNSEGVYQKWPTGGKLGKNMNKTLHDLKEMLTEEERLVYGYVLTTVKGDGGVSFVQTGSAPNFQGDLVTLCTCKHWMRTWREPKDWKGVWIAGFTGINVMDDHKNYLFYLMRVQEAFSSHKELWDWLDPAVRNVKNASLHKFGDVYEPITSNLTDVFDPSQYREPIKKPEHVHLENNVWHKDIRYKNNKTGMRPALLVGDLKYSFLWSEPKIYFKDKHPRTKKWENIKEFTDLLDE